MAKGKYQQWLKKDKLDQITNWLANGCTDEQLAQNMGIHPSTLYDWLNKHHEISEAVKNGRAMNITAVENAFFNRAIGGVQVVEEIEEFKGELKDGKPYNGTITKRTVRKTLPGDVTAQIFRLKNHAGYRNEPPVKVDVDVVPTFIYDRNADG